jgi:hypothetical protein
MDKRRSSSKKNDKGQRSSNVIKGGDDHEVSKRKGRRSSEVQSQRTDDPLKSPKGRRLSGWELREKLNNSPGRNSTGCLPNALTGSPRHTAKRHESLIASVHTSIDNCTHSAIPLLNLSSHSKCANSRAPSRTADSALLEQDDGFNLLKSTAANKKRWSKLRASTVKPSIPARAPMTPVNRRGKMDLVVNCPSSTQSCPAVREWSKLKHDSQFVNETKLQHEEARKIRETFASPTKVAAWKIREQTKKGTSGGGRCASDISADLPKDFLSSMDRRGSVPTYAVNKESNKRLTATKHPPIRADPLYMISGRVLISTTTTPN